MADLLAYWRYDNYVRDIAEGAGFNFNSKQERLHSVLEEGDTLWLITGRREAQRVGMAYYIVAKLVIRTKTFNAPEYKYGKYRVWGDFKTSSYYKVGCQEASLLLRNLKFSTNSPIGINDKELSLYFQSMRQLNHDDSKLLTQWCADIPIEQAAYDILPEYQLEMAIERGEESVKKIIQENRSGLAEYRINQLIQQPSRSKALSRQIHEMYHGRCQICGFDPILLYGVEACHAHHLMYLSRGGADSLDNMILLCPNHHSVIHATDAVFDFHDLSFVFAANQRERIALNYHLNHND